MQKYHKIKTVYKRDPQTNYKSLLMGKFALAEFEYLRNNEWVFTEKVDGTNIRIIFEQGRLKFRGKSKNAQMQPLLMKKLEEFFLPLEDQFKTVFKDTDVCLYGEGYGPKIQKGGGNYRSDQGFVMFDIRVGDWWFQRKDVEDLAVQLKIDIVPIIGSGTLEDMVAKAQERFNSTWGDFKAEGIVARPAIELQERSGTRIITKIKCKDFKS